MTLDPSTDVLTFEAVKIAMRQDKNGHVLVLSIHPNDIPTELFSDWLGSRYYVSLVKLNDDETPVPRRIESENRKIVQQAGILCREKPFQEFLRSGYLMEGSDKPVDEIEDGGRVPEGGVSGGAAARARVEVGTRKLADLCVRRLGICS